MLIVFESIFLFNSVYAQKIKIINPIEKKIDDVEIQAINRSIMTCGERSDFYIYTSLDIAVILSIHNFLSDNKVKITTNWDEFSPLFYSTASSSLNEKDILNFPEDVQKILYICTTWDISNRLRLNLIPKEALDNIAVTVAKERPWKNLPPSITGEVDKFRISTIMDYVHIVLRSSYYHSIQGDFDKNPSLWSTPFNWNLPEKIKNTQLNLPNLIFPLEK